MHALARGRLEGKSQARGSELGSAPPLLLPGLIALTRVTLQHKAARLWCQALHDALLEDVPRKHGATGAEEGV